MAPMLLPWYVTAPARPRGGGGGISIGTRGDERRAIDALGPLAGRAEITKANASFCPNKQYTAAVKSSSVDPTATALSKLGNLVSQDAKLATILDAPTLTPADKSAIVAELEKTAGTNATVKNFLQTLAENNRLGLLGGVCTKFGELMSAARGEVEMTVTSATVRVILCEVEERCLRRAHSTRHIQ